MYGFGWHLSFVRCNVLVNALTGGFLFLASMDVTGRFSGGLDVASR